MRPVPLIRQALALVLTALLADAALAQSPWYLGLRQSLAQDDNVYRQAAGAEQSAGTISSTELLAGVDLRPGRQQLSANLRLGRHRYSEQPQLDFDGYGADAALEWATAGKLSGRLELAGDRRLGSYASLSTPTGVGRNLERAEHAKAEFRLGDHQRSRLWLEAVLEHDRRDNDIDFGAPRPLLGEPIVLGYERRLRTLAAGLTARHRVGGALVLGLGLHATRGDEDYALRTLAPAALPLADRFDRHDVDLLANWTPAGHSRVFVRLSYGRRDVELQRFMRDRNAWSGTLRWDWTPTAKLALQTRLSHDSGERSDLAGGVGNEPVTGIELNLRHALGAKLTARAGLSHRSRSLDTASPADRTDRLQGASLALEWQALRSLSLGCSLGHDRRNASAASAGFKANQVRCTLTAVLQ